MNDNLYSYKLLKLILQEYYNKLELKACCLSQDGEPMEFNQEVYDTNKVDKSQVIIYFYHILKMKIKY